MEDVCLPPKRHEPKFHLFQMFKATSLTEGTLKTVAKGYLSLHLVNLLQESSQTTTLHGQNIYVPGNKMEEGNTKNIGIPTCL